MLRDNIGITATAGSTDFVHTTAGTGETALAGYATSYDQDHNLVLGTAANTAAKYPNDKIVPSLAAFGFTDTANEDYSLSASSAYLTASSTGGVPGADWSGVMSETLAIED